MLDDKMLDGIVADLKGKHALLPPPELASFAYNSFSQFQVTSFAFNYFSQDLCGLVCDSESRRIATITAGSSTTYGFDDLISCETIVDDKTLTTTNRGYQVLGGVLGGLLLGVIGVLIGALAYQERGYYGVVSHSGFGALVWGVSLSGLGVLIGALTSMKETIRIVRNVKIKLIFNNLNSPTYELQLMPHYLAEQALQEATKLEGYFAVVSRQNNMIKRES